jgi:hypothetical protein
MHTSQSIYHRRPDDMLGTVLYPLNELKAHSPAHYASAIAKYSDDPKRLSLPAQRVPKLDCLWNDVVHCAPIHPHLLYLALVERAFRVNPETAFFQIPVSALKGMPVAVYVGSGLHPDRPPREDEVEWLNHETYAELRTVPTTTLAWYDRLAGEGRLYGHFVGVPHVLVRGSIDVRNVDVVRWGDPSP